ncbi:extracellular matrix-binding ebh [Babesia caballi]|uniref:Extracellular matrix-binding ebh n=1 Tax=Babesia caballi TaxID=5871 RepID=A0AAV4LQH1_BABCB|nr:extracellular matrix-binding ebh [Babesia caballi]
MGFDATHLRQDPGTGNYILSTLRPICGDVSSPFRQLCEKLGCLTKRAPRTLGDLFGFMWHLNGQLFKTRPEMADLIEKLATAFGLGSGLKHTFSSDPYSVISKIWSHIADVCSKAASPSSSATGLSRSLEAMAPAVPFLYQLFTVLQDDFLPTKLFDLTQHCHKVEARELKHKSADLSGKECSSPNDLWSLLQPVRNTSTNHSDCARKSCGGYLSPLTHSAGATYAPVHASAYLSWLTYLADDFHEWFQSLLVEFNNIDCSKTGCRGTNGSTCQQSHATGTHGNSDKCKCDSVVHCGGVLPLLYRYGFQFYSPYTLSGGRDGNDQTKRTCQQFHSQLQNVINGDPLSDLLNTIDDFLYLFRFYFFYNQSAFWTIYICIILYTFFFLLDTLRVRSHLHFPSSNSIPPVSLLGTAKAPALKKFANLTYFMP